MIELTRDLYSLFDPRERRHLALLFAALVARAALGTVGVASIAPFMSVVADPSVVETNAWLGSVYATLGFTSITSFLMALGVTVAVLLAVTNALNALTQWALFRFSWGAHHRLSVRLLDSYLHQPYEFFMERNSADLNKVMLSETQSVINGVLTPALNIASRLLLVAAIAGLLVYLDPVLAVAVLVVLGGMYGGIYFLIKKKQRVLGVERVAANASRFKYAGEAFGGIKDVKVLQREEAFVSQFKKPSWDYSRAMASNATISQLPRFLLETIAFGGIVLVVLYYLQVGQGLAQILPAVTLYAFAGYRLMPELQMLFQSAAQIRFNRPALEDLLESYRLRPAVTNEPPKPLELHDAVEFIDVRYRYPGASTNALEGVSLCIPRNQTIGLIGATGSGKTTVVDLLLGLVQPTNGQIQVDGVSLDSGSIRAWQRQIGYVPQSIFLADDTIASNIAFGIPRRGRDEMAIERAARVAQLHEFILTLPNGYDSTVGERGVRLSGGQRQRIGIARALYRDPALLVMDEATSALDGVTEEAVMDAIRFLGGRKTIVLVAHRLSTVEGCDLIYLLKDGRVKARGTYGELAEGSEAFRKIARLEAV